MIIPDPNHTPWPLWAETVIGFNNPFENALVLWPEVRWREWAVRLSQIEPRAPRPDENFRDWRAWAAALRLVIGD